MIESSQRTPGSSRFTSIVKPCREIRSRGANCLKLAKLRLSPDKNTIISAVASSDPHWLSTICLWVGGKAPHDAEVPEVPIGGAEHGAEGHIFLEMPSNKAVTIDLAKLRQLHPDSIPISFRARVASADGVAPRGTVGMRADVFVLVDGELRFERRRFAVDYGGFIVEVPLSERDRVLTLVTTDG